jgi:hypothetical protein
MDRPKRIRIVIVAAIGLLAWFVENYVLAVVAVKWSPLASPRQDSQDALTSVAETFLLIESLRKASWVCEAIEGACLIYLLVQLAIWFIGPPEKKTQCSPHAPREVTGQPTDDRQEMKPRG